MPVCSPLTSSWHVPFETEAFLNSLHSTHDCDYLITGVYKYINLSLAHLNPPPPFTTNRPPWKNNHLKQQSTEISRRSRFGLFSPYPKTVLESSKGVSLEGSTIGHSKGVATYTISSKAFAHTRIPQNTSWAKPAANNTVGELSPNTNLPMAIRPVSDRPIESDVHLYYVQYSESSLLSDEQQKSEDENVLDSKMHRL